jgi:HD-like signal output (HDOD) protein
MIAALTNEGFLCDSAENGAVAWQRVCEAEVPYQLVVSDLAMPGRHGHALAVDLLTLPNRPLIAILTGVAEPKIAKDLLARGVDDISFKPIHYPAFAAKLRGLVNRRPSSSPEIRARPQNALPRITPEEFEKRLGAPAHMAPISPCAVELFKLTSCENADVEQVTATVQCDPALVVELLRLANSAIYNPTAKKIRDVGQAVVAVGLKRVGELALTSAAFGTFKQEQTPFIPLERVWRRCLAAGICLEIVVERTGESRDADGLFTAAVLLPMARLVTASVFPEIYPALFEHCAATRKSPAEIESEVLPRSVGEAFALRMAAWGIPDEIHQVLGYAGHSFGNLESVPQVLRRQVESVKAAAFLGATAIGEFEPWEEVDPPGAALGKRLRIDPVDELLRQCREDLSQLAMYADKTEIARSKHIQSKSDVPPSLAYLRLYDGDAADCLPPLLTAIGACVEPFTPEAADEQGPLLVNALDVSATEIATHLRPIAKPETVILTTREKAERAAQYGTVVAVPTSFAALSETLSSRSKMRPVSVGS